MATPSSVLNVLISSSVQKLMPILVGIYVMNRYGQSAYSEFSLFLTAVIAFIVLVSTGMVPALIKELAGVKTVTIQRKIIEGYLLSAVVMCSVVGVFLAALLYSGIGSSLLKQGDYFGIVATAVSIVVVLFSLSALQTTGRAFQASSMSILNAFLMVLVLSILSFLEYGFFITVYSTAYLFVLVNSLRCLSKEGLFAFSTFNLRYPVKNLIKIYRHSSSIFLPNIIWMLGIFAYHSFVASSASSSADYPSFAIAYQWLTLMVFIPGALAPLVIARFSADSTAWRDVFLVSILYLSISLIFSILLVQFVGVLEWVYEFEFVGKQKRILTAILLSGVFAAANAPLIQYLISQSGGLKICLASAVWLVVSLIPQVFSEAEQLFAEIFFLAYFLSYCCLLVVSFLANKPRKNNCFSSA